jgi:hypothetical protein
MYRSSKAWMTVVAVLFLSAGIATAQGDAVILTGGQLNRVVPASFYFEGLSAPTQMRNAGAVRFGTKRHVIVGMVDTSGYSADVRAKYQGFLITDSRIAVGDAELGAGAYGFGFSDDGKFNVFDVGGNKLLSVGSTNDKSLRRPRPVRLVKAEDGVRFYSGRDYVIIGVK